MHGTQTVNSGRTAVFYVNLGVLIYLSLVCDCSLTPVNIPPWYRTLGSWTYVLHQREVCFYDAQLECSKTENGRLAVIENSDVFKVFEEISQKLAAQDIYIGAYTMSGDDWKWTSCDLFNVSAVGYEVQNSVAGMFASPLNQTCFTVKIPKVAISISKCDEFFGFKFLCEETIPGKSCGMRALFTSSATVVSSAANIDNCTEMCRVSITCWASLFIDTRCYHFKNTKTDTNASLYQKDCLTDYTVTTINDGDFPSCSYNEKDSRAEFTDFCHGSNQDNSNNTVTNTTDQTPILNGNDTELLDVVCFSLRNYTTIELEEKIERLKQELTVGANSTNAYRRKRVCATDDRTSSQVIGYSFAITAFVAPFLILLVFDLPCGKLKTHLKGEPS